METLSELVLEPGGLALTFLSVAVKGFAILALALVASFFLRDAPASLRHLTWSLAIGALLLLPMMSVTLPEWTVPVLPVEEFPAITADSPAFPEIKPAPEIKPRVDVPPQEPVASGMSWPTILALIWIAGVAVVLLHMVIGTVAVWRLVARARPISDPDWIDIVDEISDRLAIGRPVQLLRSSSVSVPMVWGVLRPAVLLPEQSDAWDEERLRCVLAHELAHVKRFDALTQPVARVACAVHWFNPLVWRAAYSMRLEREKACDAYVLQAARTKPSNYASHLLEIARQIPSTFSTPVAAVAMARRSQLEGRVLSILDDRSHRPLQRKSAAMTVLLTILLVLPLAALKPVEMKQLPLFAASTPFEEIAPAVKEVPALPKALHDAVRGAFQENAVRDVIKRSFSVSPGGWLRIDTDNGNIEVRTSSRNTVEVEVRREARGKASVEDFIVEFDHKGSDVEINGDGRSFRNGRDGVNVTYIVTVPRRYNVDLETSGGNISIDDLDGKATVETAGGNLAFGSITGTITAETSGGNISVEGSSGNVTVETAGGSIRLGKVGGTVNASTSGGNISVEGSDGDLEVETSGGNIKLGHVGGTVRASTSGGNIEVGEVNGDIEAETSGGNIVARMASQPSGESRLSTSAGDITVYLASGIRLDIDAESHGGRIESDVPVATEGTLRRDRLRGRINGGGPALVLEGGEIRIRKL